MVPSRLDAKCCCTTSPLASNMLGMARRDLFFDASESESAAEPSSRVDGTR